MKTTFKVMGFYDEILKSTKNLDTAIRAGRKLNKEANHCYTKIEIWCSTTNGCDIPIEYYVSTLDSFWH